MDARAYAETYQRLCEISAFDSDIYMSEDFENLLETSGAGSRRENLASLVQMQLAAEAFRSNAARLVGCADEKTGAAEQQRAFLQSALERRLNGYAAHERHAIVLDLLENCRELAGCAVDEQEHFQMLQEPTGELKAQLTEWIARLSVSLLAGAKVTCPADDGGIFVETDRAAFSPGAAACAAYLSDAELRRFPEAAGVVSEAARLTADSVTDMKSEDAHENAVGVVGLTLSLIAASTILGILFSVSLGTGITAIVSVCEGASVFTFPALGEIFTSYLGLFVTELRIAAGVGASGLAVEALSRMQETQLSADAHAEAADALECMDSAAEDNEADEREADAD